MSVNIRITKLKFGPPGNRALHVCVDMQRLFAEPGEWQAPDLMSVVPQISRLAERHPDRTLFSRFMTPARPEDAVGRWQDYYRRWQAYTTERLDPGMLDLVAPLARFCPPSAIVDKTTHSCFESPAFVRHLEGKRCDTVVLTGVETEVCVLATALSALDRGLRVILVADAMTSSSQEGHVAGLNAVVARFDMQIETALSDEILESWT